MKKVKGDLIALAKSGEFDIIAHGANCHNIMGAGIAQTIAKNYPEAFEADKVFQIPVGSPQRLGCMSGALVEGVMIFNFYTQFNSGRNFNITAFVLCLEKLKLMDFVKGKKIGIPYIGCGIGGGSKVLVEQVIKDYSKDLDITLVEFDNE